MTVGALGYSVNQNGIADGRTLDAMQTQADEDIFVLGVTERGFASQFQHDDYLIPSIYARPNQSGHRTHLASSGISSGVSRQAAGDR